MKSIRRLSCFLLLSASGVFAPTAGGLYAQSPTPGDLEIIEQEQRRIERQQEEFQREQERRLREKRNRPPEGLSPEVEVPEDGGDGQCVQADEIRITGAAVVSTDRLDTLAEPHRGRCLGLGEINQLLALITQYYVDRGYVTSRAYVPPQDLTDDVLKIVVIEGKTERIELNGNPEASELLTAFPGLEGEILDLRDIEQGLDQMNRLKSNDATLKLLPGDKQGNSRVAIANEPLKRWRISATLDNSGSISTGEIQGGVQGEIDNLLGLNDTWYSNWRHDLHRHDAKRLSQSLIGNFSIPYGYWTFTGTTNWSQYRSRIQGVTQSFLTSGSSRSHKGEIERVIHRDGASKTNLAASLTHKENVNFLEDVRLDSSSRKLTVAGASLSHSRRLLGGIFNGRAEYSRGLTALGAAEDDDASDDEPRAQFDRVTADLSYYRPFELAGARLAWSSAVHGQWSPDTLYSTERLSIGGLYSVRGFKEDSLSGDVGGYLRNELIWALPDLGNETAHDIVGRVQAFAAFDIGALRGDHKDELEHGTVKGWAAGLRAGGGYLTFDLTYAQAISSPGFVEREGHEIYFKTALNF